MQIQIGEHVVLFDDGDAGTVCQHRWGVYSSNGNRLFYARTTATNVSMHQMIMGNIACGCVIDHINRNGLDNRRRNLRWATRSQNGANRTPSKNGTSQYLGVSWCRERNKWRAQITKDGRCVKLGRFACEAEAAKAYDIAAKDCHGEFANLNFGSTP